MTCHRRLFGAFLLICVSLALGDAPYIDEYLEDLGAPVDTASVDASPQHPDSPRPQHVVLKLCETLLLITCAPEAAGFSAPARVDEFGRAGAVAYSSISPGRIDRPPATLSA